MKNLKELEELQKVAVEITRLCSEYSQRAQKESHKDLEPLWNQIQDLKKQLKEGGRTIVCNALNEMKQQSM